MVFKADYPYVLLLLLLIPFYIYFAYRNTPRLTRSMKLLVLPLRCTILLLIIVLLSGLAPYEKTKQKQVLFVVDRSDSTNLTNEQLSFMNEALSTMDSEAASGIYSFGANIAVDQLLRRVTADSKIAQLRTTIDGSGTNIAQALRQAGSYLAKEGGGTIVLMSDGRENIGVAQREVQLLNQMNITVDVVIQRSEREVDIAINEFNVPAYLKEGEKFKISIDIESVSDIEGTLIIYEDQQIIKQQPISLIRGSNQFMLEQLAAGPGMHRYRAEVYVDGDQEPQNNEAHAISRVSGPSGVLIVEGKAGSSTNIESMLLASNITYKTVLPAQLSLDLTSYLQYDSIILNNVSAVDISELKMEHIEAAVKNYGIGFMMLGGHNSFGLGGYFGTPIENIAPVDMELKGKKRLPSLGLILVIDRSGSMMGDKLELAKEAAIRSIELIREEDYIGVLAFDSMPNWAVELTLAEDRKHIVQQVLGIQSEGGTEIYPAVELAVKELKELKVDRKHIILLTDGQSGNSEQYDQLTELMVDRGITLSTVAVGQDVDRKLLETLATNASGRYYYTEDQSTIPAIFSREAVMMTRTYIVEQTFQPRVGFAGVWNQLWTAELPSIDAYVATTAKPLAEVALWSAEEDPILARWNVGSGKAVAWTTDVGGAWARDWVQWQSFPTIFVEWLKWTFPQFHDENYVIKSNAAWGKTNLKITAADQNIRTDLAISLKQDGTESALYPLIATGSGQYEAVVDKLPTGLYMTQIGSLSLAEPEKPTIVDGVTSAFVVPYSPEYSLDLNNDKGELLLKQLAHLTGGRIHSLNDASTVFQIEPTQKIALIDWMRTLLIIILALWLTDIAVRRLSLNWSSVLHKLKRITRMEVKTSPIPDTASEGRSIEVMRQRINNKRFSETNHDAERTSLTELAKESSNMEPTNKVPFNRKGNPLKINQNEELSSESNGKDSLVKQAKDAGAPVEDRMSRLLAAKNKKR